MIDFTVHTVPGSPFGRSVMVALEEKGAPWQLAALAPGETKSPAYLVRHPFGRVPLLEHGDFELYETQAILRYLDRILPGPALAPADPRQAARMDQLMGINDWYLFQGCVNVIAFQRIIAPKFLGASPDLEAIAAVMPRAHLVLETLSWFLGNQAFLVGENPTLADLMVAPQIEFLTRTPEWSELSKDRPNLAVWLARLEARPSFQRTTWEKLTDLAEAA